MSSQLAERWCRTAGLRVLGAAQGSGLREPRFLLQRGDGQVLQLSELLHLVVREISLDRDATQVADAVSLAYGRQLTSEGLRHLVSSKLEPLGLVQPAADLDGVDQLGATDVSPAAQRRLRDQTDPLLTLRLRRTLLGVSAVRMLARGTAVLFRPLVVVFSLLALVSADLLVFGRGSIVGALGRVFTTPTFILALLGLLTLGSLIHELGHAAACHYGGARPGVIGVGVYLVFPAFFTNVTDSYRLDRIGRLRTDLGGLYFNVWCLLMLDASYLLTGQGLLLLAALLMHVEMAQQLIPTVRFDGYFVLADLAGVPDLFTRVRPVLLSLVPGREPDPRVTELRPAARRIVTCWVLLVVPTLIAGFGWLAYSSPYLIRHTLQGIRAQAMDLRLAWSAHDVPSLALSAISMVLLILPMLGLLILVQKFLFLLLSAVRRAASRSMPERTRGAHAGGTLVAESVTPERKSPVSTTSVPVPPMPLPATPQPSEPVPSAPVTSTPIPLEPVPSTVTNLTAAAFTDENLVRSHRGPAPDSGWRRALFTVTAGAINPGPSAADVRRAETLARVTAPINGSRRVVVMSRKGGVGKTTTTLALGGMFAQLRGDRVIAVDANPDAGNLAHRVSKPTPRTITDVLAYLEHIGSYSDLREFTTQSPETRLEVLASDDDPRIGMALNRQAYHQVIQLLDHYYNLILLDTGTGILDSANQGLLTEADQLVLVLRPALDGARAAALTLDWLSEHGYSELVASAVVVLNATRNHSRLSMDQLTDHFARRCSTVISVPWDAALEAGARTSLASLQPATRQALVELAAAVADHFVANGVAHSRDPLIPTSNSNSN